MTFTEAELIRVTARENAKRLKQISQFYKLACDNLTQHIKNIKPFIDLFCDKGYFEHKIFDIDEMSFEELCLLEVDFGQIIMEYERFITKDLPKPDITIVGLTQ